MFFSKLVFVSSTSSMIAYYLYMKHEKSYEKIFKDLQELKHYDFDHLQYINDMPEQLIALSGRTDSILTKKSIVNNKDILFSSLAFRFLEDFKEKKSNKNFMWRGRQPFKFTLTNSSGLSMLVENNGQSDCIFFQLDEIGQIQNKNYAKTNIIQKAYRSLGYGEWVEYGVMPDERYTLIGQRIGTNFIIKPKILLGSDLPEYLRYLDSYLVENNKKGKTALAVSLGILGTFFVISKFIFPEHFRKKKFQNGPAQQGQQ